MSPAASWAVIVGIIDAVAWSTWAWRDRCIRNARDKHPSAS